MLSWFATMIFSEELREKDMQAIMLTYNNMVVMTSEANEDYLRSYGSGGGDRKDERSGDKRRPLPISGLSLISLFSIFFFTVSVKKVTFRSLIH
jgi:hypothetical protein